MGIGVDHVLLEEKPEVVDNETIAQTMQRKKWEWSNKTCKRLLLDGLSDDLFDVYQPTVKIEKELWDTLNDKYDTENARKKKFLVSVLYDFKMMMINRCYPKSIHFKVLCIKLLLTVPVLMNSFKFLQSY